MSVQIPTAEGPPPEPQPPTRRPPGWVLAMIAVLVAVTAVAVSTTGDDRSEIEEQVAGPAEPNLPMQQWDLTVFPGSGVFIDLATGQTGAVAVTAAGADWEAIRRPSHVWASDAELATWRWVDVERSADATITSVTRQGETIVASGYLHADGFAPALWTGTPETGLRIIDETFPSVERLSLVRNLDGHLVIVGIPTEPSGLKGIARVLVEVSGDWTDVTPESAVQINEIISTGDEWIAVGSAENQRPGIWHSNDQGVSWTEHPLTFESPATVSDITVAENQTFAIVQINPLTAPRSQLVRLTNGSWQPTGEERTTALAWLAPVGEGLIGGSGPVSQGAPRAPYLWQHEGNGEWRPVSMRQPADGDAYSSTFAAATDLLVVGAVTGQPALWMAQGSSGPTVTSPVVADDRRLWERVAVLPPDTAGADVLPNGHIFATAWRPVGRLDAGGMQLLVSEDSERWNERVIPSDLFYHIIEFVGDQPVLVGAAEFTVVVGLIEEDGFVGLAEIDGNQLEAVDVEADRVIVYVRVANTISRVEVPLDPAGATKTSELDWSPLFIRAFDDGVVVGGESKTSNWPPDRLQVSTDAGETWTGFDMDPVSVHAIGPALVLLTNDYPQDAYRIRLDPISLEPIDLPDELFDSGGPSGAGWAGGLASYDPSGRIHLLQELGGPVATLELSPATGFDGVFLFPADEAGHIVAMEGGERVLYRWTGRIP